MPAIIECINCGTTLQVPEELFGHQVRCPKCGTVLVASVPGAEQPPRIESVERVEPLHDQASWTPPAHIARARGMVLPPALGLLFIGLFGLLFSGFTVVSDPDEAIRNLQAQGQQIPPKWINAMEQSKRFNRPVGFTHGTTSLLIVIGAAFMLSLKARPMAMISAVLALIPCATSCCCFPISLPIGIWALVVLNKPEVVAAFR